MAFTDNQSSFPILRIIKRLDCLVKNPKFFSDKHSSQFYFIVSLGCLHRVITFGIVKKCSGKCKNVKICVKANQLSLDNHPDESRAKVN